MIREADPRIGGLSIEGDYLFNRCVKCGESFHDEQQFQRHMAQAHSIVNGVGEVHGLHLTGLSLVLAPEVPGVADTSFEVMEMEMAQNKIYETILREKSKTKEDFGMSKSGIGKPVKHGKDKLRELRRKYGWSTALKLGEPFANYDSWEDCISQNQDKEDPEAYCASIKTQVEEQEGHGCTEDQVWDSHQQKCVPKPEAQEEDHGCLENEVWNPTTQKCEPIEAVLKDKRLDEIFLKGTKRQIRKVYVKVLGHIDECYVGYKDKIDNDLRKQLYGITEVLKEIWPLIKEHKKNPSPALKETEQLSNRVEKTETRLDNLEAKLRGQFKGHNKAIQKPMVAAKTPRKMMRETAKKQ